MNNHGYADYESQVPICDWRPALYNAVGFLSVLLTPGIIAYLALWFCVHGLKLEILPLMASNSVPWQVAKTVSEIWGMGLGLALIVTGLGCALDGRRDHGC